MPGKTIRVGRYLLAFFLPLGAVYAADLEADLRDFLLYSVDAESQDIVADQKELQKLIREASKPIPRSEIAKFETKVRELQAEALLADYVERRTRRGLDEELFSKLEFTAVELGQLRQPSSGRSPIAIENDQNKVKADIIRVKNSLKEIEARMEDMVKREGVIDPLDSRTQSDLKKKLIKLEARQKDLEEESQTKGAAQKKIPIDSDSRLYLVANLERKSDGNTDLSFRVEVNPAHYEKLPREVRERFSKQELDKYMREQLGANFGKTIRIEGEVDEAKLKAALDQAKGTAAVTDFQEDFRAKIKDLQFEIGNKNQIGTKLGNAEADLQNAKSDTERKEKLKAFRAKMKLLDWLKKNQAHAEGKEPCDVFMMALKWEELPAVEQEQCSHKNPAKLAEQQAQEAAEAQRDMAEAQARQQALMQEFIMHAQRCESLNSEHAMQVATKQVTDQIQNLYDAFVEKGVSSALFTLVAGDDMLGKNDNDPLADIMAANSADAIDRAINSVGHTPEENERLKEELSAVRELIKRAWLSLQKSGQVMSSAVARINAANQAGQPIPLDISGLQSSDQSVVKMTRWYNQLVQLQTAIVSEINERAQSTQAGQRFSSSVSTDSSGGAPKARTPRSGRRQPSARNNGGAGSSSRRKGSSNKPRYLQ